MKVTIGHLEVVMLSGSVEIRARGAEHPMTYMDIDQAEIMAATLRVMVERSRADAAAWSRCQQMERDAKARNPDL